MNAQEYLKAWEIGEATVVNENRQKVINTLIASAKTPFESGDNELHKTYCEAMAILLKKWHLCES